ncbi:MAG: hypothetical protein QM766_22685 [Burkholderiaceae bacterium]
MYLDDGMLRSTENAMGIGAPSHYDDRYGQVHVLELPPGKHVFKGWRIKWGAVMVCPVGELRPLEFTVNPGQVLYLGNFHMHGTFGRSVIGIPTLVNGSAEIRDNREIDIPIAEAQYPSIRGLVSYALLPSGPWETRAISRSADGLLTLPAAIPQPRR